MALDESIDGVDLAEGAGEPVAVSDGGSGKLQQKLEEERRAAMLVVVMVEVNHAFDLFLIEYLRKTGVHPHPEEMPAGTLTPRELILQRAARDQAVRQLAADAQGIADAPRVSIEEFRDELVLDIAERIVNGGNGAAEADVFRVDLQIVAETTGVALQRIAEHPGEHYTHVLDGLFPTSRRAA